MCNGEIYAGVFQTLQQCCDKGKAILNMDANTSSISVDFEVKGLRNHELEKKVIKILERHFSKVTVSIKPLSRFQCMFDKHMIFDKSL